MLGEAISNSWDADSENVWIYIVKDENSLFIKDDGVGMTADEFQNKFLKIGYSKRKDGGSKSARDRPFIGRKGIGKLALLSCADRITVISKTEGGEYVGGTIDNSGLDKAIVDDLTPDEYPLEDWSKDIFAKYVKDHDHGTIIYFENIKDGIKNSLKFLKKLVALYFRFSLLDETFSIYLNDEIVDHNALSDLAEKTEFLWTINDYADPYVVALKKGFTAESNEQKNFPLKAEVKGFIASVEKPMNLSVWTMDERVGIDLFVNGRVRERDVLKHIPTSRIAENYLYGQIHYNDLDDAEDRFTSSREGIVADDPKFKKFLDLLRKEIVLKIIEDWDAWRRKHRKDGDSENPAIPPKERKSRELYNVVSADYELPVKSEHSKKIMEWVDALAEDAQFNFSSYAECFISENLVRNFIEEKAIALTREAEQEVEKYRRRENDSKERGNVSIDVRRRDSGIGYLSMDDLANLVDKKKDRIKEASLSRDASEYKPVRDAVAHTALLTDVAKAKLTSVYENIKARVRALLAEEE